MSARRPSVLRLLLLVALVGPSPVAAQPLTRTDQVVPDEPPIPVAGLLAYVPGVPAATAAPGVTLAVTGVDAMTGASPDATFGRFLRFASGPVSRLTLNTPAFLRAAPVAGKTAAFSGATLALWYRHPSGSPKVAGWNPIVFAGRGTANDWSFGLVLEDGVPSVLARRTTAERFGVALGGGSSTLLDAIDDGQWHHLAVRMSRPGCVSGNCPRPDTMLATLVVDGNVAGETTLQLGNDEDLVFTGSLPVTDSYTAQSNFVTGTLKTVGDIDDLHVYEASLSLLELRRIQTSRQRGHRFQIPPLAPGLLGWNGPSPAVGGVPATGLPSRPLGGNAPVDLTDISATNPSAGWSVARSLEGVTTHTFVVWTTLPPSDGPLYRWRPTPTTGWDLSMLTSNLTISCIGGNGNVATASFGTSPDTWRLLGVTTTATSVTVTVDHGYGLYLECATAATAAGTAPRLELARPEAVRLGWAAFYAGAKPAAELLAIASPGPTIWLNPMTNVNRLPYQSGPIQRFGAANTDLFAPRWNIPGTVQGIRVPARGTYAVGNGDPDYTLSFDVTITDIDGRFPYAPIAGRFAGGRAEAYVYLVRSGNYGWLTVNVVDRNSGFGAGVIPVRVDYPLPAGPTYSVTVAWPLERRLEPEPGLSGASLTVREPGVTINGVFINRRYSTDPDRLIWGQPLMYTPPYPHEIDAWNFGDPGGQAINNPPLTTRYRLRNIRVYGRAIADASQIGMTCPSAQCSDGLRMCAGAADASFESNRCSVCDNTAFSSGGTGLFDHDCVAKKAFHDRCDSDVMCSSGRCLAGTCVAESLVQCESECLALGRQCGAVGASFDCVACKAGFTSLPGSDAASPRSVCTWSPTLKAGDTCEADGQCLSGACRDVVVDHQTLVRASLKTNILSFSAEESGHCKALPHPSCNNVAQVVPQWAYQTRTVFKKACLASRPSECTEAPLFAAATYQETLSRLPTGKAPPAAESARYSCATGDYGACRPNFTRTNPVLTPTACQAAGTRAMTQVKQGRCYEYGSTAFSCGISERPSFVYPASNATWTKTSGLSMRDLKVLFLAEDTNYNPAVDYPRLRIAGVGPLLIAYASGNAATKAELTNRYGAFEPVWMCGGDPVPLAYAAYHRPSNYKTCAPLLQPNGAVCPPSGSETLSIAPNEFCLSNYCSRDDRTCERGDNPLREIRPSAANQNRSGRASVKFGIVRVDDTQVEMERPPSAGPLTVAAATAASDEVREYEAWVNQSHVLCILGAPFPNKPLFETRMHLDRQAVEACSTTDISTFILGFKLTSPAPGPIGGSCTSYSSNINGATWDACLQTGACQPVDPKNLSLSSITQMAIPELVLCAPISDDAGEDLLPELRKDFKEFLVPVYISFGPTLDLCLKLSVGLDDGGMPQIQITPNVGVGVEAKAALGSAETSAYEIGVGIRLAVTIIDIAFPITWGFAIEDGMNAQGQPVFGLLELQVIQKMALELTILSGEFGIFAAFSVGPFSFEWTFNIFTWAGIEYAFDLASSTLLRTKLDFTAIFAGALQGGAAAASCNNAPTSPCYQ